MQFITIITAALMAVGVTAQQHCLDAYKNCFNGSNCVACRQHVFDNVNGCERWAANTICVTGADGETLSIGKKN